MSFSSRLLIGHSKPNIKFTLSIMATEQDNAPDFNWEGHSGTIIVFILDLC